MNKRYNFLNIRFMKKQNLTLRFSFVLTLLSLSLLALAQSVDVTGVVYDKENNEPLIGVTVAVANTGQGTITDIDGKFAISVESGAELTFSFIGYLSQKQIITPPRTKNLNIYLESNVELLGEVVAIGYGTQKKKEVTGSVASVKPEDFNAGVKTNPVGLLQGKVAGLNIVKTSSDPTSTGYDIQIRGFSTLDKGAGTSPLFIVDGIPVNNIDNISTDEIASMDVLKDGSAAAIYGTRGTNGVIIITTKRGEGFDECATTKVEYTGYASFSFNNSNVSMATPEEFRDLENLSSGAVIPVIYEDAEGKSNYATDWMSELTRKAALTHNHNVAISGASRQLNYRASLNYKKAEGIAKTSQREEYIAKITASQKALDNWLELQYDLSYMHYRNDFFTGDFKQAAIVNPTYPVYDASTTSGYFYPQGTGQSNPVENMNNKESYGDGNYFRGSIKGTVHIKPIEGLKISGFGAIEEGDNYKYWYNGTINSDESGSGKAGRESNNSYNRLFEITGDYITQFDKHTVAAVIGFSYQNFLNDEMKVSNKGFPTESSKYYQIGNGDASKKYLTASSGRRSNTLVAMFARANYNYDNKYLLSASIRREGSSRFGQENKWGLFPAVSAGWRISGENFMNAIAWVDDLKVRIGFGVTGNNLNSDLRSVAMLSNKGSFWYNGQYVYTYGVSQNVNPDLRWEKKYEYNFGVDYDLLKNRLYGSLDVYYRQTRDLLWDYEVPTPPYQFPTLLANAGQMDSYGLELVLSAVAVKNRDWTWTTTPTIAFNHNSITKLSDPDLGFNYKKTTSGGVGENGIMNTNTQILIEGKSVGAFYGYKTTGMLNSNGLPLYATPAGGYTSDPSEGDRMVLGSAQPKFTYGWNNTVTYKDFDLAVFFRGVYGNKILNVTRWAYGPSQSQSMNVYLPDAKEGKYTDKSKFTDEYLEDGSYLKLDNITLGYTLPVNDNKLVKSMRIYATGQNLFTLTKYTGLDPEVNTTGVWNAGIDYPDFYPSVATALIGLNITLK